MTTFSIPGRLGLFLILASFFIFSNGHAETELDVGFIPIMPMSQLFVMEGEGWTEEVDSPSFGIWRARCRILWYWAGDGGQSKWD